MIPLLAVKPKVNVKPVVKSSSVKPSAHVRPGQKRKAAAGQGSAVAAVKPLSPASTAGGEASELQEPPCKRSEVRCQHQSSFNRVIKHGRFPLFGPFKKTYGMPPVINAWISYLFSQKEIRHSAIFITHITVCMYGSEEKKLKGSFTTVVKFLEYL